MDSPLHYPKGLHFIPNALEGCSLDNVCSPFSVCHPIWLANPHFLKSVFPPFLASSPLEGMHHSARQLFVAAAVTTPIGLSANPRPAVFASLLPLSPPLLETKSKGTHVNVSWGPCPNRHTRLFFLPFLPREGLHF